MYFKPTAGKTSDLTQSLICKTTTIQFDNKLNEQILASGSGHETAAVLLPGFAINW